MSGCQISFTSSSFDNVSNELKILKYFKYSCKINCFSQTTYVVLYFSHTLNYKRNLKVFINRNLFTHSLYLIINKNLVKIIMYQYGMKKHLVTEESCCRNDLFSSSKHSSCFSSLAILRSNVCFSPSNTHTAK